MARFPTGTVRGRAAVAGAALILTLVACERGGPGPDGEARRYEEAVSAFHSGLAAIQVGESAMAEERLRRVTELAPEEPSAWANLGLALLLQGKVDEAEEALAAARARPPADAGVELLSAVSAAEAGRAAETAAHLRRAVELDPGNPRALHLLARTSEEAGRPADALAAMDRLLVARPRSVAALLERAGLAARAGLADELRASLDRLAAARLPGEPAAAASIAAARDAADAGDLPRAAAEIDRLRTRLQPVAAFRADQDALAISPARVELRISRFLRLPNPSPRPAPPDTALAFAAEPLSTGGGSPAWIRSLWLSDEAPVALLALGGDSLWIGGATGSEETFPFPGGGRAMETGAAPVAPVDFDYDFRMDLALAGPAGVRLLRQERTGSFTDVTASAIPASVARGEYAGTWGADLDADGDMDLVLARMAGAPVSLRNRGDGTFEAAPVFEGVRALRDFVWADLDAEGTPDAVLLDAAGRLHLYLNRRFQDPQFEPHPLPAAPGAARAVRAADLDADGVVDLVVLDDAGRLTARARRGEVWEVRPLGRWGRAPSAEAGAARLFVADLDNNGATDLVASDAGSAQVWLATGTGFRPGPALRAGVTDVGDLDDEGRLDLLGRSETGEPVWLANRGTLDYHWMSMSPRASGVEGDRRINTFGIGGEIEIRAGLLYQKQPIQGPTTHFGLGERREVQVARILWPHGGAQAEFDLTATDERMVARQRLQGSCPWVFSYDGREMRFVTDFIWRTALGLRINGQGTAGVIHSEDWIRIGAEQMAARDGAYDVRITADLWETHFFDHVGLMAVDHPEGTELLVDERFALPPPALELRALSPPRPVARAWDHRGLDVTALVRARDERYLDTFELGAYQGLAEEHFVEVLLGDDVPSDAPLWLVASGWIYPTDSSINLAISQGAHPPPQGLRLEVPDGAGGWTVAESDLGFPAGKSKTILIDLSRVFRPGTPRRLRLRTNLEVYWDRLAWSVGRPDARVVTRRYRPATAELRYRGFSRVRQASRRAPELPEYGELASTAPRWRDLEGYHTRFGDVLPLVDSVDGRYVIMNAGDELRLRFPEAPAPRAGWTRTFVLTGDGWVKDGNFNTGFSRTVLPLPFRGMSEYDQPPGRLEDDPAFRLHPDDWATYHTRYVTPAGFHRALLPDP